MVFAQWSEFWPVVVTLGVVFGCVYRVTTSSFNQESLENPVLILKADSYPTGLNA